MAKKYTVVLRAGSLILSQSYESLEEAQANIRYLMEECIGSNSRKTEFFYVESENKYSHLINPASVDSLTLEGVKK